MNTYISNKLVSGVGAMMVPFSVRMRQSGMVRVPNAKPLTSWWVPIQVVNEQKEKKVLQSKWREHLADSQKQEAVRAEWKAAVAPEREWGEFLYKRNKVLLRELPKERLTPVQFRAWVSEGHAACRDRYDERLYWRHVEKIRLDYFAELPECVFVPAVRKERDAHILRAYREGHVERKRVREIRNEIRHLQVLLMDYLEAPSRFFDSDEERDAELEEVTAQLVELFDQLPAEPITTWSDVVRK